MSNVDWSAVADSGARLENLVACQLFKCCPWIEDTEDFRAAIVTTRPAR